MEKFMENIEVKYKIIEIDTQRHSMIVRYFTDEYDEDKLATSFTFDSKGKEIINRREDGSPIRCETDTNITIWQTPTPNVSELQLLASSYAPRDWFKLKMAIANNDIDTSMSELQAITNQTFDAILPPSPVEQTSTKTYSSGLTEDDIEKLIAELSNNVSSSNT